MLISAEQVRSNPPHEAWQLFHFEFDTFRAFQRFFKGRVPFSGALMSFRFRTWVAHIGFNLVEMPVSVFRQMKHYLTFQHYLQF
jgi:hypothetical protein